MRESNFYEAVVEKVIPQGRHGPYAVARHKDLGLITFSLNQNVWQESDQPECGTIVVLGEIRRKPAGWRAMSARFFTPNDQETRKEEKSNE